MICLPAHERSRCSRINASLIAYTLIGLLFCSAGAAHSGPQGPETGVDWDSGFVYARGLGLPPEGETNLALAKRHAERAAQLDAMRNLTEIIHGLAIDAEVTVHNRMASDHAINTRVSGFLRGVQPIETHFHEDRSAEVLVRVALNGDGSLSDSLYPAEPRVIDDWTALLPPAPQQPTGTDAVGGTDTVVVVVTGIIINADEMGLVPSLSPAVFLEDGSTIYARSPDHVDPEIAEGNGLVGWASTLDAARESERVATHPLILTATAVKGTALRATDLVLSSDQLEDDIDPKSLGFLLRNCKVVIVY
ncbi:MAG: hypothetical protein KAY32_09790 [Candidatus Eisenbacteria sp.]|nr:hypothetical protein [Candidatus Eisenbacteria bacterium]